MAIAADRTLPEREGLRLLSIEADDSWNRNARLFDRRVSARNAKKPVQMPAGRVIAGRFDTGTNDAVALSKPTRVKSGETTYVWPTPPVASDVLLVLDKPRELQLKGPTNARLALNERPPDVLLDAFERLIAIWYGVDARRATISLKSDTAHWPSQEVRLVPGKVTTVRSRLQRLPSVEVSVIVPPDATLPADISLEVSRPSEKTPFRRVPMAKGLATLDALPAEPLSFILKIDDWKLGRDLDLSVGIDDRMVFELQPIVISGTVFWAFSAAMQPVWRGVTEVDGGVEIPAIADGAWLLIRHAGAATSVRRWSVSDESVAWKLDRPAEPLTLVVERNGGKHVSGAHVVLWLDDVKLSGVPLTFATWSAPATNPSGVWIGRNLPAKPIRVLALPPEAGGAIATTAYDAVGRRVDYPWPARVSATTP